MTCHIAILQKKYLEMLLAGRKTVECRLTRIACAPFGRVAPGEQIWLKLSAGPVLGRAVAARVDSHRDLTPARLDALRRRYQARVQADDAFWQSRRHCRYATFITLTHVQRLPEPLRLTRKGYQPWITLPTPHDLLPLLQP